MSRFPSRCKIAALLLILSLTASWASAADLRGRAVPRVDPLPAELIGRLLGPLWERVSSLWNKNGASVDPNGQPVSPPATNTTTPNSDNGASLDPNG